jgi:hypothetical protein
MLKKGSDLMYTMFRDGLVSPSRIPNHLDDKKWKFFIYALLIIVLYALPSLTIVCVQTGFSSDVASAIREDFTTGDVIQYELKNQELISTSLTNEVSGVGVSAFTDSLGLPVLFVFDGYESNTDYEKSLELAGKDKYFNGTIYSRCLVVSFHKTEVEFTLVQNSNRSAQNIWGSQNTSGEKTQENLALMSDTTSSIETKKVLSKIISYAALKATDVDFSEGKKLQDYSFQVELTGLMNQLFRYAKNHFLWLVILGITLASAFEILMMSLIICALSFFLYRFYEIKFGRLFKMVLLAMTPNVVCYIISAAFGLSLFVYVGMLITVIFTVRAMRYEVIRRTNQENNK